MKHYSEEQIREAFLKVFACDEGAIVLAHLNAFTHADSAEFIENPRLADYVNGRRSVVLEINKILKGENHELRNAR